MLSPLRNRAGKRLREPFGKAGLTVAVIALVFAMLGGAYAATKLNGTQKKEVEKIAKKFQGTGPAGAKGDTGAAGANGSNGKDGGQGTEGKQGSQGIQGIQGTPGTAGKNVAVGTPTAEECPSGGATVQVSGEPATKKAVCNGAEGNIKATLGVGQTETGSWYIAIPVGAEGPERTAISFPIPLAAAAGFSAATVVQEGETVPAACENAGHAGAASAENPEATSGHLCVFVGAREGTPNLSEFLLKPGSLGLGFSTTGSILALSRGEGEATTEAAIEHGTFAVTG